MSRLIWRPERVSITGPPFSIFFGTRSFATGGPTRWSARISLCTYPRSISMAIRARSSTQGSRWRSGTRRPERFCLLLRGLFRERFEEPFAEPPAVLAAVLPGGLSTVS